METKSVLLVGVGGQGAILTAKVLVNGLMRAGYDVKMSEVHGMSQRGGDVQSNLRISSEPIHSDLIPYGSADLIVSLEPMEALRYVPYLSKEGWIVTNTNPFVNIDNYPEMSEVESELEDCGNVVAFNMDETAKSLMSPRSSNMVLLGAASPFIDLKTEEIEQAIANLFSKKGVKIVESNIGAFKAGRKYTEDLLKSRTLNS